MVLLVSSLPSWRWRTTSHSRTVRSWLADTSRLPSGLERHVGHAVGVAGERRTEPALGGDVPQSYPVVAASGRDRAAIRAERQAVDVVEVGSQGYGASGRVGCASSGSRAGLCGPCRRMRGFCRRWLTAKVETTPEWPLSGCPICRWLAASHHRTLASVSGEASSFPSGLKTMLSTRIGARNWPALLVRVGNREDRAAGGGRRRD